MVIYNLDTSVIIDYIENRSRHTEELILKIIKEDVIVIYSDVHIEELKQLGYNLDEIDAVFKILKSTNIRHAHIDRKQLEEAEAISYKLRIPKGDVLHAIIARDNDAVMITNGKDFDKLRGIADIKKPKDLL